MPEGTGATSVPRAASYGKNSATSSNVIALPGGRKRPSSPALRPARPPLPISRIAAHLAETLADLGRAHLWLLDDDVAALKRHDPARGRELERAVDQLRDGQCALYALVEQLGGPVRHDVGHAG